jgi:hypothetical protein
MDDDFWQKFCVPELVTELVCSAQYIGGGIGPCIDFFGQEDAFKYNESWFLDRRARFKDMLGTLAFQRGELFSYDVVYATHIIFNAFGVESREELCEQHPEFKNVRFCTQKIFDTNHQQVVSVTGARHNDFLLYLKPEQIAHFAKSDLARMQIIDQFPIVLLLMLRSRLAKLDVGQLKEGVGFCWPKEYVREDAPWMRLYLALKPPRLSAEQRNPETYIQKMIAMGNKLGIEFTMAKFDTRFDVENGMTVYTLQ